MIEVRARSTSWSTLQSSAATPTIGQSSSLRCSSRYNERNVITFARSPVIPKITKTSQLDWFSSWLQFLEVTSVRSSRCSPTRMAFAIAVRAGFTAPMLGKKLVSTTYRLSSSWALQCSSSTEDAGSLPKRHVPAWCAHPATGMFMSM